MFAKTALFMKANSSPHRAIDASRHAGFMGTKTWWLMWLMVSCLLFWVEPKWAKLTATQSVLDVNARLRWPFINLSYNVASSGSKDIDKLIPWFIHESKTEST